MQRKLRAQRIGDYLAENEIVSREQLGQAIRHQETRSILSLGEALRQLDLLIPAIRRMIQTRAPISERLPAAFAGGISTLKQDGIAKVLQVMTDAAQVRAVCV